LAEIIFFIWIIGISINLCKNIRCYQQFNKTIGNLPTTSNIQINYGLQKALRNYNHPVSFKIVQAQISSSPFIYGVFKPKIFVPNIDLCEEEWYYILSHETAHYYNGDLWIKIINEFICIVYWWNPFIYLLKKQISKTIEIHTDLYVTKSMSKKEKNEYLECILKMAKNHVNKQSVETALTFDSGSSCTLSQRFYMILDENPESKIKLKSMLLIIVPVIFLLGTSFLYVFEPYYISPEAESSSVELTSENSYLVKGKSDGYDVYYKNQYFGTIKEIKDIFLQFHIYKNIEEARKK